MSLSRSLARSASRSASRKIVKEVDRRSTYRRVQDEAASRSESTCVGTPFGDFWMSPIEVKLYEAMRNEGLSPVPQYRIEGYITDFAFPDERIAVEADGVAYHTGERRERDRRRDWILRQQGWTVKRFYGTTIHNRASNCAYVVKREIEGCHELAGAVARQREIEQQQRREAIARPFRKLVQVLRREERKRA